MGVANLCPAGDEEGERGHPEERELGPCDKEETAKGHL